MANWVWAILFVSVLGGCRPEIAGSDLKSASSPQVINLGFVDAGEDRVFYFPIERSVFNLLEGKAIRTSCACVHVEMKSIEDNSVVAIQIFSDPKLDSMVRLSTEVRDELGKIWFQIDFVHFLEI